MQLSRYTSTIVGGPGGSSAGSTVPTSLTRFSYADRSSTGDPGTRLVSPITDGGAGSGISFVLTGGWTSTDWGGAWPYVTWQLKDLLGVGATADTITAYNVIVKLRTGPGDSTDTAVRVAIINESDVTTATVDGVTGGLLFSGATRNTQVGSMTNGSASALVSGTTSATITGGQFYCNRIGMGASTIIKPQMAGLDASNVYVASTNVSTASVITVGNPSAWYLVLCAGRTATTAGNATVAVDVYMEPLVQVAYPA